MTQRLWQNPLTALNLRMHHEQIGFIGWHHVMGNHGAQPDQGGISFSPLAPRRCRTSSQRPVVLHARAQGSSGRRPTSSSRCPDTRTSRKCCSARRVCAAGLSKRQDRVDMSSISPIETKAYASRINELAANISTRRYRAAKSGKERGADDMIGGPHSAFDKVKSVFELMGRTSRWSAATAMARPQGRQSDHRRAQHRSGGRSAAVRVQAGADRPRSGRR